jgi:hypothetical protein
VETGTELAFGSIELAVEDLGPGESPHDSIWLLGEGREQVFSGDQAYNHMHGFLADGHWESWLTNIAGLEQRLPETAVLHVGHGEPASPGLLAWQRGYVERFIEAVRAADWADPEGARGAAAEAMDGYLEAPELRFLMELSIDPVAAQLGLVES